MRVQSRQSLSFFNLFPCWRKRAPRLTYLLKSVTSGAAFPIATISTIGITDFSTKNTVRQFVKVFIWFFSLFSFSFSWFSLLSSIGHHCSMLIILTKYRLTSIPTKGTTARYLAMRRSIFSRAGSTGLSLSGSQRVVLDNDPFP